MVENALSYNCLMSFDSLSTYYIPLSSSPVSAASMAVTSSRRNSFTMKRTNDWVNSTDIATDITIQAGGISFLLHKFPLVAKCGRIRRMVAEACELSPNGDIILELGDIGADAFELTAKFCYGGNDNFEITASTVAMLRCAAEYLEMSEEYGQCNLISRSEKFLKDVAVRSFGKAITVLRSCEKLVPLAEELNIVNRCIDAVATMACEEEQKMIESSAVRGGYLEWWAEDLSMLSVDIYERVLTAMKLGGMPQESMWPSLIHYAQHALHIFNTNATTATATTMQEQQQRDLVETIVSLLPPPPSSSSAAAATSSASFLFGLLRTAIILDTSINCRYQLERRIALQLQDATIDDLLIPSFSFKGDTMFDTEIIHRIFSSFIDHHHRSRSDMEDDEEQQSSSMVKAGKLLDAYLAEVAADANLKLSHFINLAQLIPKRARISFDGIYRAIDIYLKTHPSLGDIERKRICKVIDIQRLSSQAVAHAAQNERLPIHFLIQLLYSQQQLILKQSSSTISSTAAVTSTPAASAALRKENTQLRLEMSKMSIRMSDIEKEEVMNKSVSSSSSNNSNGFIRRRLINLSKLNPFAPPRSRRHSIS